MIKNLPKLQIVLQAALLGLFVAIVLAQSNPFYQSPNRDGGLFMYMGGQILKGKTLYVDIWDNKGPLIFYLNALGLFLGQGYRWGVWGLEFVFVYSAALLGFLMMKRMWGLLPAIFATSLWLSGFNKVMRGGNFTEDYSLLFNFFALYLFSLELHGSRWWRQFLIGVMLAFNFLLRANNIGVELSICVAMFISAILDREYALFLKKLAWIGAGTAFIFLLTAGYFYSQGTLEEMVTAGYTYNFFYSNEPNAKGGLLASFRRGVELLGYQAIIPAVFGYFVFFERLPGATHTSQKLYRPLYMFLLVGWPLEIFLSGLSGRNYPHYYICWLPYIALLSGSALNYIISAEVNARSQQRAAATLLVIMLMAVVPNLYLLGQYKESIHRILFERRLGIEYVDPVAKYIRDHTNPTDTALVWGFQPYINLMARRDSSTGILSYPLLVESPYSEELNKRFYTDLVTNKPVLIVDMVNPDNDTIPHIDPVLREAQRQRLLRFIPPSNLNAVFEYIFANYHLENQIGRVMIYRLNDSHP